MIKNSFLSHKNIFTPHPNMARMFHTAGAPTTSHYGAQPYVRVHPPKRRRCTRQGKGLFRVGVAASRFENRSARNACTGARMRSPATQQRTAVPWREHLPDLMTACTDHIACAHRRVRGAVGTDAAGHLHPQSICGCV